MAVTLVASAPDATLLNDITGCLRQEDIEVCALLLDSSFSRGAIIDSADLILISKDQELDRVGDVTDRFREVVGPERRFVLCVRLPGKLKRQAFLNLGASEVISPASTKAADFAERILAHQIQRKKIEPYNCGVLYGGTKCMRDMYDHIKRLAPLNMPVLILGELGTGKELIARELHNQSGRSGPFKAINCPEFSHELFASELFGHLKGAFTGADRYREGLIAAADNGTAFLDEIGDLHPQSQPTLLRLLQENTFRHVGSDDDQKSNARILLGTNRNLFENARSGMFRDDLLSRISGFTLELPPLRERRADIPLLVDCFLEEYKTSNTENLKTDLSTPPGAVDLLFEHDWSHNVRGLKSAVFKAAVYAENGYISSLVLQEAIRGHKVIQPGNVIEFNPGSDKWPKVKERAQAAYFKAILARAGGVTSDAIEMSGLSKAQFHEIVKKLKESGLL